MAILKRSKKLTILRALDVRSTCSLATDAALILARARARCGAAEKQKIGHLPAALQELVCDERGAYSVQLELHRLLAEQRPELGEISGTKIGCTTAVMQDYLGMPHPCSGAIWSSTAFVGEGDFTGLWRAGVECEIAVRLATDIAPLAPGVQHTRETVSTAVGEVMAAIEIVDDRYANFEEREPGPYVWVADDFFGAGVVVAEAGARREGGALDAIDLSAVKGEMRINGVSVGSGYGRDIINGHPLEALVWLANKAAELRGPTDDQTQPLLPSGHTVMLGSVVQTKWVNAGDVVTVSVDGLGSATARFT